MGMDIDHHQNEILIPGVGPAVPPKAPIEASGTATAVWGNPEEPDFNTLLFAMDFFTKYFWMLTNTLGIPGNAISFFISLMKENRQFSTCIYMAALAIVDTAHLLDLFWIGGQSEFQIQCVYYTGYSMGILSGLFLTMMSVDRLIVVRFPLAAKRTCTTKRALKAIAVSVVLVMGINVHIFFIFKQAVDKSHFIKVIIPGYPALETAVNMFHLTFGSIAPFAIIIVCNIWIIVTLRAASKDRKAMVAKKVAISQEKDTRHLTRMLLFVCAAYIMTSLPYRMHDLVLTIPVLREMYDLTERYWYLRYTTQYYVLLAVWHWNYGINFYLYCIGGGKKYRADVLRLFRCKVK
ncbi:cysteinyl leukotriene receptor 1-like [Lineus longissimus]|uniref:cysteinyl leukotriene receptor 1-like n=1 Tax=Lineus longissimus TaxID=88925 RepID=UPI002B4EFF0F